jgi:hypothetical protein
LSSDIVDTWPSASSPSNIQPSAPLKERIGDVAETDFDRGPWPGGRAGSLDPLALQVARDLGADEVALARVLDLDRRAGDDAIWIEEADAFAACGRDPPGARCAPAMTCLRAVSKRARPSITRTASSVMTSA